MSQSQSRQARRKKSSFYQLRRFFFAKIFFNSCSNFSHESKRSRYRDEGPVIDSIPQWNIAIQCQRTVSSFLSDPGKLRWARPWIFSNRSHPQEHALKTLPTMVQRSHELESLQERMNGLVFDVEYSVEAVKDIENSQKYLNVTINCSKEKLEGDRCLFSSEYSRLLGEGRVDWETDHSTSAAANGTAIIPEERWAVAIILEELNIFVARNYLLIYFLDELKQLITFRYIAVPCR